MSWIKITLTPTQVYQLHRDHVPEREDDEKSLLFLELEEWLEEWCRVNCKDRVKIRTRLKDAEEDSLRGGPVSRARWINRPPKTIQAMYIKFKNADDAMIFRLTL